MKVEEWRARISNRTDLTQGLVHLTKPNEELNAFEVLMKILKEKRIIGSTNKTVNGEQRGFICGKDSAVCFQDVPLLSLSENILHEQRLRHEKPDRSIRYGAFGLRFDKRYIFKKGGRPVLYEVTEIAKSFLPEEEHWRIVKFDLGNTDNLIDWTHEREWRIKGDLDFELKDVEILLSHEFSVTKMYEYCQKNDMLDIFNNVKGIVTLKSLVF